MHNCLTICKTTRQHAPMSFKEKNVLWRAQQNACARLGLSVVSESLRRLTSSYIELLGMGHKIEVKEKFEKFQISIFLRSCCFWWQSCLSRIPVQLVMYKYGKTGGKHQNGTGKRINTLRKIAVFALFFFTILRPEITNHEAAIFFQNVFDGQGEEED